MMTTRRFVLLGGAATVGLVAASLGKPAPSRAAGVTYAVMHSDAEWKKLLTPAQYEILRQAGTERPFTSPLLNEHRHGLFACAGCNQDAFSSTTKFDSHTGWPSFWAPLNKTAVSTEDDRSLGMDRTEVHCTRCGGHLGHVFDDGPRPTGLRYCMNGYAMIFKPTPA
jgi:peptide-methionine (R)-S-oxide reductase